MKIPTHLSCTRLVRVRVERDLELDFRDQIPSSHRGITSRFTKERSAEEWAISRQSSMLPKKGLQVVGISKEVGINLHRVVRIWSCKMELPSALGPYDTWNERPSVLGRIELRCFGACICTFKMDTLHVWGIEKSVASSKKYMNSHREEHRLVHAPTHSRRAEHDLENFSRLPGRCCTTGIPRRRNSSSCPMPDCISTFGVLIAPNDKTTSSPANIRWCLPA